jgi:hypothetical protein
MTGATSVVTTFEGLLGNWEMESLAEAGSWIINSKGVQSNDEDRIDRSEGAAVVRSIGGS